MNVPKLRFKEFNDEWKTHKLSDIGEFLKGGKLNKSDLSLNGIPCILYGELYTFYNEFATRIKSKTFTTSNLVLSKKYDILLPLSGETAEDISTCTCVFFDNIALGGDLLIFRNSLANSLFISLLLKYKYKYKIAQIAQGKSVVHINIKNLKNIKVNLPPLEEQNKLSNFLFVINKKIENLENTITSLENQKKGLLQQIFSQKLRFKDKNGNNYPNWEKKKLEDISNITMGQSPDSDFVNNEKIGTPFLQGNAEFTNKYPIEKYWCTKPQKIANSTDILLSVRAPVGAINIANKEFCIGRGLSAISFNCNKLFGKYNLEFNLFQLIKKSQGSTFSSINKKDISEIILFIPCLEEQTKIADFLSAFDRKLENQKAQLEHWKQIKKGLLQQMFV